MSDRGEYASIPKVLTDGPDYQKLPANARFIFLTLCLSFNGLGIEVRYPEAVVAELVAQTGLTADAIRLNLDILEHEAWIKREHNILWLIGRLDHSGLTVSNVKKHVPHVRKVVAGLPRLEIVREFVIRNRAWFEDEPGKPIDSFSWTVAKLSKPYRKPTDRLSKGIDRLSVGNRSPTDSQDLPKIVPNQTKDAGAHAPDSGWVAEATDLWRTSVGHVEGGHIAGTLKGAVAQHGWQVVRRAMLEYVGSSTKIKTPKYFAADVIRWIAEADTPLVDEHGCPTAKADRIVRASA